MLNSLKSPLLLSAMLSAALGLTACSSPSSEGSDTASADSAATDKLDTKFLTIATGGASGPYNIIGTSLSEVYVKTFGVNSKTQTTGASVENVNLLTQGKVDMVLALSDVVTDAVEGKNNFEQPITNIQQIAVLYPNVVQIVTSKKSGIKNIEDLRGKRIAVGDQGSGTEVNARTLLEGFGITYDDVTVDYLGFAEAADGMKAGKIEAAFFSSGLPNSSLMELEQGLDLQIVTINQDKLKEIIATKPYFKTFEIPAGTYGNETAVPTAAIMNALLVSSDLSEADGYKLTKALFDNLDGLKTAHQAANDISLETARDGMVAPIHPGAKKYYDEQAAK
ncbi:MULTISPECIES: TAXI family TRAP transporter solute-binding subunit [Psychrobacter]|uniref:TAXI family TRAP transporter solute-binding subunit n=1 Tax=Psychrobacter TaxID=497 RepID=UPI0008692839|nr:MULTISPECIES: TAXI family TRAP transporter solute-binding subunit [Psychrobacter]MBA6244551.1 TAXI family TRAP transporter solute-binding subunit [Psychrobacter sp. Urea-trap-18]MBA6285879.1 TAXI family TRAP transporter solute-binding subunit [Psychrobacter sp. Urea-trap-16]MBA6317543.1 TAXI family TRAP transporter solute-binding subunit [Psychrobacter sp. Urea-trap-20]MBA6333268.1 TAXI family TRAP transporter solute-binding subunit [Psychrobacter sp. Urea-trap-19]OEH67077.1 MAG: C4-dicarbo